MLKRAVPVVAAMVLVACGSSPENPKSQGSPATAEISATNSIGLKKARFTSIEDALKFIETKVDVPILLPDPLPPNARLDHRSGAVEVTHYAGRGITASLNLIYQHHGLLRIDYGAPTFAGCDRQFPVYTSVQIGAYPAILGTGKGYAGIVWPATNDDPVGKYELQGTFSGSRIMRLAASMKPVIGLEPLPPPGC